MNGFAAGEYQSLRLPISIHAGEEQPRLPISIREGEYQIPWAEINRAGRIAVADGKLIPWPVIYRAG